MPPIYTSENRRDFVSAAIAIGRGGFSRGAKREQREKRVHQFVTCSAKIHEAKTCRAGFITDLRVRSGWLLAIVLFARIAGAQVEVPSLASVVDPTASPFRLLRYEDRTVPGPRIWTALKRIPFGSGDLSVGGEMRVQYIARWDDQFGRIPGDQQSVQQRYLLHANFAASRHLRLFAQLASAWEHGKKPAALPIDEDRLDVQQLFAEWALDQDLAGRRNYVRIGRQELLLGGHELLKVREGPNVRLAFDAARLHLTGRALDADVFAGNVVQPRPGAFDDRWLDRGIVFSGVNVGGRLPSTHWRADVFYFDYRSAFVRYEQASGREHRGTLGVRISGTEGPWDFDYEISDQFGALGSLDIRAWGAALFTGYRWPSAPLAPKLTFGASYVTGDRDRTDYALNTFNCLFARGDYFGDTSLLTGANTLDLGATLETNPARRVRVTGQWDFLWRSSTSDGLYAPPQIYFRDGRANDDAFIGQQLTLNGTFAVTRFLTLQVIGAIFLVGDFIRHGAPAKDTSAVTFRSQFKF